jgi:hypothetical protein
MSYEYPPPIQSNNNESIIIGGVIFVVSIIIFLVIYNNFINVPTTSSSNSQIQLSDFMSMPSSDYANCKGEWGTCSAPCGEGTQKYKIITPKKGEGKNCPEEEGASKSCKIKDCADNCIGNWTPCSTTCGEGTQTYIVTNHKKGDGKNCPFGDGASQACSVPGYILDCPAYHNDFKDFYKKKDAFELIDGGFSADGITHPPIIPNTSKKISNNQCELQYSLDGVNRIFKRRFTLERNDANCKWNIIGMGATL